MVPGPVFGNVDYFQGLAIIVDTYSNHNGPHNVSQCRFKSLLHLQGGTILGLLGPEDEYIVVLQNVYSYLPVKTA
jgi:hypothetical protein